MHWVISIEGDTCARAYLVFFVFIKLQLCYVYMHWVISIEGDTCARAYLV